MSIVYKIGFDELVQSMSFFLDFPEVEDEIEYLVAKSAAEATLAEVTAHAKKNQWMFFRSIFVMTLKQTNSNS